jgi:hypothetical protein
MKEVFSIVCQSVMVLVLLFIAWHLYLIVRRDATFLAECTGICMVPWEIGETFVGLICERLPSGRRGVKSIEDIGISVEKFRKSQKLGKRFLAIPFGRYRSWSGKTFYEGIALSWTP